MSWFFSSQRGVCGALGVLLAIVVGLAQNASAATLNLGGLAVSWEAPLACPDRAALEADFQRLNPTSEATTGLEAAVQISEGDSGRWSVTISWSRNAGTPHSRSLDGTSCAEVSEAALLILSLVRTGGSTEPQDPEFEEPEPSAEPEAQDDPPAPPAPRVAGPATGDCCGLGLMAGALVEHGGLPGIVPGLRVGGSLHWRALRLESLASIWIPSEAKLGENSDPGVSILRWTVGLAACADVQVAGEHVHASLCAGAEIGDSRATGVGVANPSTAHSLWLAPHLSPQLQWDVSQQWQVLLAPEILLPLRRPEFIVAPYGALFQADRVAFRGILGVRRTFSNGLHGRRH